MTKEESLSQSKYFVKTAFIVFVSAVEFTGQYVFPPQ